ncbi:MAG: Ig-like domain-containing protein [Kofleriaceae bacterium]|nr:Ig-like domain-containing protein [Kofleriaceae bacterium]
MFVDPIRARGLLVATAVFAAGACDDPTQNTDLRPDGPPEVLAVLVMNDAAAHLRETATYCAPNDSKRPTLVGLPDFTTTQICDPDMAEPASMVTDAYPDGWYIRVMFDELLDPDIEELEEIEDPDTGEGTGTYYGTIANTKPVKLECESVNGGMVEVEYDGYYSPSGNQITWPLGPSLVIKPNHPELIATNKMCRVTLKENIVDKSGEQVPADQLGPYAFQIAPITPIFIDPEDGAEVDGIQLWYDNVYVQFNTEGMDPASIACDDGTNGDECEFSFSPDLGGGYSYPISHSEFGFGPNDAPMTETEYVFEFKEGAKVVDRCGVETTFGAPVAGLSRITVTTNPFDFNGNAPSNGDTVSALRKLSLQFNNVLNPASLEDTEYTLVPEPEQFSIGTSTFNDGDFLFLGNYRPGQQYTFTLNAGATIEDAHGKVYTQEAEKKIIWTVAPIAISSTDPADEDIVTKATTMSTTQITINFNQAMNPASIAPTEWEVVDSTGAVVPFDAVVGVSDDPASGVPTCAADGTSTLCGLVFTSTAALTPGTYKFTLKAGATIEDQLAAPTVYTQASDRVVTFTVANPTAVPPVQCL